MTKRVLQGWLAAAAVVVMCAAVRVDADGRVAEIKVIVNADNPDAINANDLESYFLRKQRHWSDGTLIIPLNFSPPTDNRRSFDRAVLRLTPDEVARYWLDQRIRSGDGAPREVDDPTLTIRLVGRLKGAICYVPASADTGSARVVARILDGKVLAP
jgi:hypothetical protein